MTKQERKENSKEEETGQKSGDGWRWLWAIAIAIALCAAGYLICAYFFTSQIYQTSEEFEDFADYEFSNDSTLPTSGYPTIDYQYNTPLSVATRYDELVGDDVAEKRDQVVKSMIREATLEIAKEDKEQAKVQGQDFVTPERAILIDSSVTESGTGAVSLAVYKKIYKENKNQMELESSDVHTILLSEESCDKIKPIQALSITYKDKAAKYVKAYLAKKYDSDDFTLYYQKYLDPDNDDAYRCFIMRDQSIRFFFQPGTVLNESQGVIAVNVPNYYMGDTIRKELIKRYIDPNQPMVAITYDDGPGADSEERIIKCLKKYGSVATFFYLGQRVEAYAYNGKAAVKIGCEIGNHSWDHPTLTTESTKQVKKQVQNTNDEIKKYIGVTPTLLRPPYGDFNDRVIRAADMPAVLWTIDTLDWKTRSPKKIFNSVKNTKNLDGKIILMHSIYDETADATEKIVPWLKSHGYQTVTVSELIKYKTGKTPKAGTVYRTFQ